MIQVAADTNRARVDRRLAMEDYCKRAGLTMMAASFVVPLAQSELPPSLSPVVAALRKPAGETLIPLECKSALLHTCCRNVRLPD